MLAFPSAPHPHPTRVAPVTRPLRASESHPSSSDRKTQLNWFFSNPPKSSVHASGAWCHSHPLVNLSLGFLFWHQWTTHPPRARVNTCAQVCPELTHVLSRKVFNLTKPKGKIYKTKSLGHYITLLQWVIFSCLTCSQAQRSKHRWKHEC